MTQQTKEQAVRLARPLIGDEEQAAVARVLDSGMISQGPEVAAFEEEFSEVVGGRHCVAVNSGTSALHVALLAIGIGPGDEVIVPSFTFAATANAVRLVGAEPVFADIELETFCLDPNAAAAAITDRTAAIMPVHLFGHPADMASIGAIASRNSLAVIEDAAQAHLAAFGGQPVGSFGDAAAFSFYPTKNMTTGEGGMVALASADAARTARLLRSQGMERQYQNEIVGFNLRMTDIAAAIGRVQLRRLEERTEQRRRNAATLTEGLEPTDVTTPIERAGCRHVFHQYTVRSPQRDELLDRLATAGVEARIFYPIPVHRLPAFDLSVDLPNTTRAIDEVASLPVAPHLTDGEITRVIEAVRG